MAKPRIFVSSTYYDLKHIRSSLELFIESQGYDSILSEKGDIAYLPDAALDESCYREAAAADIFVLIIGGRYGSERSAGGDRKMSREFFDKYDSVTRKEFETAYEQDIPVFILIESGVYAEYQTYARNRENENIRYAHVDSMNVFRLIEFILGKPRNNPVYNFDRSSQIETWLREQWAGMFRELLKNRSQQKQLLALTGQVGELKAANDTLRNYLEALIKGLVPNESSNIISEERQKYIDSLMLEKVLNNRWFRFIVDGGELSEDSAVALMKKASTLDEAISLLRQNGGPHGDMFASTLATDEDAQIDFNAVRGFLGLSPVQFLEQDRNLHRRKRRKEQDRAVGNEDVDSS